MDKERAIFWVRFKEASLFELEGKWVYARVHMPFLDEGWSIVDFKPPSVSSAIYVLVERESRKPKEFDDDPPDGSKR